MNNKLQVVIGFTPYVSLDNVVPLAPALLKSCLVSAGVSAKTIDYNNKLFQYFAKDESADIANWLMSPWNPIDEELHGNYLKKINEFAADLCEMNVEWIALSSFSYQSHQFIEDMTRAIKAISPNQKIMIGGSNIDMFKHGPKKKWADMMLDDGLVDAACIGEGEQVIIDIVKNDRRGLVYGTQLSNSDMLEIPIPDFDDYDLTKYADGKIESLQVPVTASKGCVRACSFCDVSTMWPKFRYRSGNSVAEEILTLNRKYGFTRFRFTDSLINGGLKPFREMNTILADRLPEKIRYWGQFICRSERDMPPKDFDLMAAGGCSWVNIGIEAGSESVRQHMRKQFTDADIHYTAEQLIRVGVIQQWNLFVGYPTETEEDFQRTLDLVEMYAEHRDLVNIVPVGLFKMISGTPIMGDEYVHELGTVTELIHGHNDIIWTTKINPENTFEVRYNRWKRLIDLVMKKQLAVESTIDRIIMPRDREIDGFMKYYKQNKEKR